MSEDQNAPDKQEKQTTPIYDNIPEDCITSPTPSISIIGTEVKLSNPKDSVFSLGLPPIKRKKFPYYPYSVIIPKCKPINWHRQKKKCCKKKHIVPWAEAITEFYQTAKESEKESDVSQAPSIHIVESTAKDKVRVRRTATQAESTMKFKMAEIQFLFATEMKELQDTYQKLKKEPDPQAEAKLEETWNTKKAQLQAQIDQCMTTILDDIKAIYFKS